MPRSPTCDVLMLPTLPILAPPIGAPTIRVGDSDEPVRNIMLRLTQLFNLTRHPAMTLPVGVSAEGLAIGLQLVGSSTERLLDVAAAVEAALRHGDGSTRLASAARGSASADID